MPPKACIVDHSFHKQTHSFDFVRQFLSQEYELHDYWDDAWNGGGHVPIEQLNEYETIFFFQSINPTRELAKVRSKMVWIPMYDDVTQQRAFWLNLSTIPIKTVCFSKRLHEVITSFGVPSIFAQDYQDPARFSRTTDFVSKRVFFWLRGSIGLHVVAKLLGENNIDSMDLQLVPDPKFEHSVPDPELVEKYHIRMTRGFLSRSEYLTLVSRNNIYIAPRMKEGIGLNSLEALTMGQCVLAHNDSTMNEYIINGRNGILFDAKRPQQVDLSAFESLANQAYERCVKGWSQWQNDIGRILDFTRAPFSIARSKTLSFMFRTWCILLFDGIRKRVRNLFWSKP